MPPTNLTALISLTSLNINIPAGASNYIVEDEFTLPVSLEVLAVLPHTHYLGKNLDGWAVLPNGTRRQLLSIPDWDFNWQGDYRYAKPVDLPAGTRLQMRYVFDNSSGNPRNPSQPPEEVRYGSQTSDEMAELWFQVRLASGADATALAEAYNQKQLRVVAGYAAFRLERNPRDSEARTELGFSQWSNGKITQAIDTFHRASEDAPGYDQPHYYLGVIYRQQNRLMQALQEFQQASQLNPQNAKAFGNLGIIYMGFGDLARAETNLVTAIELNPADKLSEVRKARALK